MLAAMDYIGLVSHDLCQWWPMMQYSLFLLDCRFAVIFVDAVAVSAEWPESMFRPHRTFRKTWSLVNFPALPAASQTKNIEI